MTVAIVVPAQESELWAQFTLGRRAPKTIRIHLFLFICVHISTWFDYYFARLTGFEQSTV